MKERDYAKKFRKQAGNSDSGGGVLRPENTYCNFAQDTLCKV